MSLWYLLVRPAPVGPGGFAVCGLAGVPGPAVRAGLLGVPVGGGPPASRPRRELRSARRLEARPGPATAHGHRSQASGPSGALHTGGAWRSDAWLGAAPRSPALAVNQQLRT